VLGDKVWDVQSDIRVRIGPLDATRLGDLIEERGADGVLVPLVRSFLDGTAAFEIVGHVNPASIQPCTLGGRGADGSELGRASWLCASVPERYEAEVLIWLDNS